MGKWKKRNERERKKMGKKRKAETKNGGKEKDRDRKWGKRERQRQKMGKRERQRQKMEKKRKTEKGEMIKKGFYAERFKGKKREEKHKNWTRR